ncbi:MAG: tRNA (adenosine(37)-N6)-threonylcarbamoyltransferase complex ATPase subunit type 1 TsaE [candidate division WOR-3 bacterium]|nr:tRNA (adenosine(37)-N6)-threonylcarbamoyltransferase complex ATPase subunit type 1 TsaE [candidate division WOR-3 bacterium]
MSSIKKIPGIKKYLTNSPKETLRLGKRIAQWLRPDDILFLSGELGSGKTTLTRGICQGLGIRETITSSSFVIVSQYQGRMKVSHIDLYRLKESDCTGLPVEEYYMAGGITIIEWADRFPQFLHRIVPGIYISMRITKPDQREIIIEDLRN